MINFLNPRLNRLLKANPSNERIVQVLLEELWQGGRLLVPFPAAGTGCMQVRISGAVCIPAFTSGETAGEFMEKIGRYGGPALFLREMTLDALLDDNSFTADRCLALDPGTPECILLPRNDFSILEKITAELTGGRSVSRDFPLMQLHLQTIGNADRVKRAGQCGCFHCMNRFPAAEVQRFLPEKDGGSTALCPRCGVDSVLSDQDTAALTDELIAEMNRRFFASNDASSPELRLLYMHCVRERILAQKGGA